MNFGSVRRAVKSPEIKRVNFMSVTSESIKKEPLFTLLRLVLCIFKLNIYFVKKLLVVFAEFLGNDYVIVIDKIFLLVYRVIIDESHTGNH